MYRLTAADLLVGCLEILQQNSPKHHRRRWWMRISRRLVFCCPRLKATRRTGPSVRFKLACSLAAAASMADFAQSLVVPTNPPANGTTVGVARNCCQPDTKRRRVRRGVRSVLHYLLQQLGSRTCRISRRGQLGSSGVGQVILFKEPVLNGVRGSAPVTSLVRLGWFEWRTPCQFRNCLVSKKLLGVSCKPALLALASQSGC